MISNSMESRLRAEWWREIVQFNIRVHPCGILLAGLYALAYWTARHFSFDQLYLPAGVRVATLLLVPPRWWPYLLVGEYGHFAYARHTMIDTYGLTWAILGSAFLMPAVMLILHLYRRMMEPKTDLWLMSIAATSAFVVTTLNLAFSHLLWPTPPTTPFGTNVVRFLVGDFIGILTLAPLALLWNMRGNRHSVMPGLVLPTAICFILMSLLAAAVLWIPTNSPSAKTDVLLLMALPAMALTCMHGWRGAAISVPLWSLIVRLTMPSVGIAESFDPASFSAKQSLAILGISLPLLAVGSCLPYYYHQHRARERDRERSTFLARSAHIATEMDLRKRALDIRKLGDGLDHSLSDLADWLRCKGHDALAASLLHVITVHSRKFREQVTMVYPTSLEHVGLYLALQIGGIHEAWKNTDRLTLRRLGGDPCQLSVGLQLAAYRSIAEAVSLLLMVEAGQIQLRARSGSFHGAKGILVSVAVMHSRRLLSADTARQATLRLAGRTLGYNGTVRCRRNRIRIVLMEPAEEAEWLLQLQPDVSPRPV